MSVTLCGKTGRAIDVASYDHHDANFMRNVVYIVQHSALKELQENTEKAIFREKLSEFFTIKTINGEQVIPLSELAPYILKTPLDRLIEVTLITNYYDRSLLLVNAGEKRKYLKCTALYEKKQTNKFFKRAFYKLIGE